MIITCCFRVTALSGHAAYHQAASLPSGMEFNCLRSSAMGKVAGLSIYWQDAAYRLVFPVRQVALVQLYIRVIQKNKSFYFLSGQPLILFLNVKE